jgi:hypothetical protein
MKEAIKKLERLLLIPNCENQDYKRKDIKEDLKEQIYKEQEGKCYLCNCKTTNPLTHHIIPNGESVKENLIMLCPLCHQFIHWLLKKYLGYKASAYRKWY